MEVHFKTASDAIVGYNNYIWSLPRKGEYIQVGNRRYVVLDIVYEMNPHPIANVYCKEIG